MNIYLHLYWVQIDQDFQSIMKKLRDFIKFRKKIFLKIHRYLELFILSLQKKLFFRYFIIDHLYFFHSKKHKPVLSVFAFSNIILELSFAIILLSTRKI